MTDFRSCSIFRTDRCSRRLALAALVAFLGAPYGSVADAQRFVGQDSIRVLPAPKLLGIAGLFQERYARVGDDLFIAGQPTERALRELKALGVTTIVNLRTPQEMHSVGFDEAKLAAELGMRYVFLPVRGNAQYPYSRATLDRFTEVMQSTQGSVLLHCTIGWRASHLWAAYLIQRGIPVADALTHTRAINLMDDHRMSDNGLHPVEEFLGRQLPGLQRVTGPPAARRRSPRPEAESH